MLRVALLALVVVAGCARTLPAPPEPVATTRLLVLTPSFETDLEVSGEVLREALAEGLRADAARVEFVDPASVSVEEDCASRAACLRAVGAEAGADQVVVCQLASLGDTAVVRVRMVAVRDDEGEVIRQVVVTPADEEHLRQVANDLGAQLGRPFVVEAAQDPRRRRVRIAVPTVVGAAAAALTLGFALRDTRPPPDVVVVPP